MSTTASIFKKRKVPYTVIGGSKVDRIRKSQAPLAVLLLNRGSRFYRQEKLQDLQDAGIGEIICVEGPRISYDIEPLSREFPEIRFLLLQEQASAGERINIGIEEARARLVFVLWSDMEFANGATEGKGRGRAEDWSSFLEQIEEKQILCTVPRLFNSEDQEVPCLQVPALIKGKLKVMPWKVVQEGMPSLFPFDYCGIYHRNRFGLSGGYDAWMSNPYWQKLDFGLRAFLWGEHILCRRDMVVRYCGDPVTEDSSPDISYKLFFLKNMGVRFNGEMGILPVSKRFAYCLRSDSNWLEARNEFKEVQLWVHQNRYRFKSDVQSLVNHWEIPE
ncbi:MAG: hypothetical protein JSV89_05925 [Spirochaetaceae bacterium]|nr:MAG: hypothetical protein JSV89_05925 [Spirochaetaceae bacterium]